MACTIGAVEDLVVERGEILLSRFRLSIDGPNLCREWWRHQTYENIKDILADLGKLALNLLPTAHDHDGILSLVTLGLLILLDGQFFTKHGEHQLQ